MEKYVTHVVLRHNGKTYHPDAVVELDDETAKALGRNVTLAGVAAPEKPLEEKTVKELRSLAKSSDIPKYWEKDKGTLVADLKAVADNEPVNG